MVADFRRRFWVSLALTPPVLFLSPLIQHGLGLGDALTFRSDGLALIAISSVIYVHGGWPFLTGCRSGRYRGTGIQGIDGPAKEAEGGLLPDDPSSYRLARLIMPERFSNLIKVTNRPPIVFGSPGAKVMETAAEGGMMQA